MDAKIIIVSHNEEKSILWVGEESKGINTFRAGVRSAIRGVWKHELSASDFVEEMNTAIEREFWLAFKEGIEGCGYTLDDLEEDEKTVVLESIQNSEDYVAQFAIDIENARDNEGLLESFLSRAELWVNRYNELVSLARVIICGDQKLKWNLGATEQHCDSCSRLNGIVKRASFWESHDVHPQGGPNEKLTCSGYRCDCHLDPTTDPVTKGPLPSLP